ncbi:scarecrow-like protein 30 [Apium graveolens]|uniref:scarecrow-like protein 30 n=1 Tax=Apium graveolens TaxID=4045 RepID=UPI003D7BF362
MSLEGDYFHGVHQYINDMLMEDGQDVPMFHESAIQTKEKSFNEVLDREVPSNVCPLNENIGTCQDKSIKTTLTDAILENVVDSSQIQNPGEPQSSPTKSYHSNDYVQPRPQSSASSSNNVNYLVQILMKDDQEVPVFPEFAIQAIEKSLCEALKQKVNSCDRSHDENTGNCHIQCIKSASIVAPEKVVEPNQTQNPGELQSSLNRSYHLNDFVPPILSSSAWLSNNVKPLVQMLVEDVQEVPVFPESAIQAIEKSLCDALKQKVCYRLPDENIGNCHTQYINCASTVAPENVVEPNQTQNPGELQSSFTKSYHLNDFVPSVSPSSASLSNNVNPLVQLANSYLDASKGKKHSHEESTNTNDCLQETQSNKKLARYSEEITDLSDMLDKVSLCPDFNTTWKTEESVLQVSKGRFPQDKRRPVVALKRLLNQCVLSISSGDNLAAKQTLDMIREQFSPHGDGTQRLAHYIATAIEARIHGTGTKLYADCCLMGTFADTLKAYQSYFTAVPFQRMSNIFANKAIYRQTMGATKLHIIDFGISYGFQWPCIIQAFSSRPGGSPYLRITGIDFPEPGFLPLKRVEKTGSCLGNYCKRFNIPFEYNCIAKKWDSIELEDLKIEEGERLVVNCLYRLRQVPDESAVESGPRNVVLKLIKRINPELFVVGVLNGTYSSPFFNTRFRDAMSHFATLSDMFEATLANEDASRLVMEQEMLAKDAINVLACEGTARVERPEKYSLWTSRIMKAGFMQTPLPKEILAEVKGKVRLQYNKKFLVREDNRWMLQGWNGRVLYALSLWTSVQE